MRENEITLESLAGLHELTGVDRGVIKAEETRQADSNCLLFVLDGVAYRAVEDPSDGYRSSLSRLEIAPIEAVANTFAPVPVLATYKSQDGNTACELLSLTDVVTGQDVVVVGTRNTDDYYPYFVDDYTPEAMACNRPTGTKP